MVFDMSKARGRMAELGYTQEAMAAELGISANSFNRKMNGKSFFTMKELYLLARALKVFDWAFFFTLKV